MSDVLTALARLLEERRGADPSESYVAALHARGLEHILKKVGEEAVEVVIAGAGGDAAAVVRETADLWFHTMVLLAHLDRGPADVLAELERRLGRSGHTEKAERAREPAPGRPQQP